MQSTIIWLENNFESVSYWHYIIIHIQNGHKQKDLKSYYQLPKQIDNVEYFKHSLNKSVLFNNTIISIFLNIWKITILTKCI